jgi:hypothetical protein
VSPRRRPARSSHGFYDAALQLEKLPPALEVPWQRALAWLGRCLAGALALFAAVTAVEARTGWLAGTAGSAWARALGRLPSATGGQGSVGLETVLAFLRQSFRQKPVSSIFLGDSIFAPPFGGGAVEEVALEAIAASQVPGAVNLSQEGWEWGARALLIDRVAQEPDVRAARPLLVTNVDFKYYSLPTSYTPPFPIEMSLCADHSFTPEPEAERICEALSRDWPAVLSRVESLSAGLLRGLQGQFDFFMTFAQRAPLYSNNMRGFGQWPLRSFTPGLADALRVAASYRARPPDPWQVRYRGHEGALNRFGEAIVTGYRQADHPKHLWLHALSRAVAGWPGPALVIWVRPGPEAEESKRPDLREGIRRMEADVLALFRANGKVDQRVAVNRDFLPEVADYVDTDHLTVQGHRKLAQYVVNQGGIPR